MRVKRFPYAKVGATATVIYFAIIGICVWWFWDSFSRMSPNECGDFLAGTIGPVALIWVVLGFFLQSQELQHSVEALKLQAEELRNSVEQQKELVQVSRDAISFELKSKAEEALKRKIEIKPKWQLQGGGGIQTGGRIKDTIRFTNLGGDASNFTISIVPSPFDLEGSIERLLVKRHDSFDIKISLQDQGHDLGLEYQLMITCKDTDGDMQVDHFTVKPLYSDRVGLTIDPRNSRDPS